MLNIREISDITNNTCYKEFIAIGYVGTEPKLKTFETIRESVDFVGITFYVNYPKLENNAFRVNAWQDIARALARKVTKGSKVFFQGRLEKDNSINVLQFEALETIEETKERQRKRIKK